MRCRGSTRRRCGWGRREDSRSGNPSLIGVPAVGWTSASRSPPRRSPLAGDGWGTMTRFRQVTSPASGLLRSLILDSVLFGNRLKSDRLLGPVITLDGDNPILFFFVSSCLCESILLLPCRRRRKTMLSRRHKDTKKRKKNISNKLHSRILKTTRQPTGSKVTAPLPGLARPNLYDAPLYLRRVHVLHSR